MVPSLAPVDGLGLISSSEETNLKYLVEVFFFDLDGRICNLGFNAVPEFSAAN